jgi:hypothetical protein
VKHLSSHRLLSKNLLHGTVSFPHFTHSRCPIRLRFRDSDIKHSTSKTLSKTKNSIAPFSQELHQNSTPFFPLLVIVLSSDPDQIHNLPILKPNHKKELQHSRTQALPPSPSPTKSMNSIHPYARAPAHTRTHSLSLGCTPDPAQVLKLRKNWIDGNSFFSCSITKILCTIPDVTAREKRRANLDTPDATKIFPLQQKARKQTHRQEANKQTNHTPVFSFRSL